MNSKNTPRVTVHRIDPRCGDEDTCEQFTTMDTDPEGGYVIAKRVSRWSRAGRAARRAHRGKIGRGEVLTRMDRELAPEVWS